jgi:cytochrome c
MQRTLCELCAILMCGLSVQLAAPARAQDAATGKQVFAHCSVCHSIDGTKGVGPSLQGIVGRKAGTFTDFRYSRAMKAAKFSWDDETLGAYLSDPQKLIPGNVMPFAGEPDAKQRADLIAYLNMLK